MNAAPLQTLCLLRVKQLKLPRERLPGMLQRRLNDTYLCCTIYDHVTASEKGHLDCILRCEPITSWHFLSCIMAATNGHLKCLEYFRSKNLLCYSSHMMTKAAFNGHIHIIKFLKSSGINWESSAVEAAVLGGHYNCLVFLIESGCRFNNLALDAAASYDRLDCLLYLLHHGLVADWRTMRKASGECRLHLESLVQHVKYSD